MNFPMKTLKSMVWLGLAFIAVVSFDAKIHLFIQSGQSNMAGLKPALSFTPTVEKSLEGMNASWSRVAQGG